MLPFLTACLANNLVGGGGGGPFTISAVNLTQNQAGTSCANPYKVNASLVYSGSPSGKTVTIELSWDRGAYTTVATGVSPTSLPYVVPLEGYYNKFGEVVQAQVRMTDDADSGNTATSAIYYGSYTRCDA